MRIPNKFNGYSADNRRIYNDPTLVVATIANMGEGAAAAASIAEATAAAAAASEAATTAAAQQATEAAAQQAGQAGIMQGASVPPPGVTPPGAPGFGAPATPLPPAQPLPPAGETLPPLEGTPFNTPMPETPMNAFPSGAEAPYAGPQFGQPPGPNVPPAQNLPWNGADQSMNAANNGIANNAYTPPAPVVKNSLLDGFKAAYEGISKTVKDAPMPFQALGTMATFQKFMTPEEKSPKKEEYKRTPYAGLSPNFQPGGPSSQLYGGPAGTAYAANGGLMGYDVGGPVEQMSNVNAGIMPTTGQNNMYPMSQQKPLAYANPSMQNPISQNVLDVGDAGNLDPYTGMQRFSDGGYAEEKKKKEDAEQRKYYSQLMSGKSGSDLENDIAQGQAIAAKSRGSSVGIIPRSRAQSLGTPSVTAQTELNAMFKGKGMKSYLPKMLDPQSGSAGAGETDYAANGGIMHGLGGYSDGGRLLKGPGDGVSDSIPAVIGSKQPARLADGEFVIPARIVSELGNGSTEAGARQLYAMMERIQKNRKKSVGKGKVAVNSKAAKHLPA